MSTYIGFLLCVLALLAGCGDDDSRRPSPPAVTGPEIEELRGAVEASGSFERVAVVVEGAAVAAPTSTRCPPEHETPDLGVVAPPCEEVSVERPEVEAELRRGPPVEVSTGAQAWMVHLRFLDGSGQELDSYEMQPEDEDGQRWSVEPDQDVLEAREIELAVHQPRTDSAVFMYGVTLRS